MPQAAKNSLAKKAATDAAATTITMEYLKITIFAADDATDLTWKRIS